MATKKVDTRETVALLDMHAILHRAYHALPDFASAKGEPTGALYGLVSMIMKMATDIRPDYVIACYDLPQKTHRHEAYDDYKAGRSAMDNDLSVQIERSRSVLDAFAIPYHAIPGFEADDLLGTFAHELKKNEGLRVVIVSGDMDTMQLVDKDKVVVYTLKKGITDTMIYDEKAVVARYGFKPTLVADFKGLRGDPSDNIIGVRGVGEKTATSLITEFGSIESIYKALENPKNDARFDSIGVKERMRGILRENAEEAAFSKALATIRLDAQVPVELPPRWRDAADPARVEALLDELSFRSLRPRVRACFGYDDAAAISADTPKEIEVVDDEKWDLAKVAYWLIDSNHTHPAARDAAKEAGTTDPEKAYEILRSRLVERGDARVLDEIEVPLIPVVREMCATGVAIDMDALEGLRVEYSARVESLQNRIREYAGEDVNVNSPKQLGDILFKKLGLGGAKLKKTAGGALSTKESELERMKDEHPIVPLILEYREIQKLLSTYVEAIMSKVSEDGRLRATFMQTGTTTGRMSSRDPNLQNLPSQNDTEGVTIRHAFVAPQGKKLVAFDYSQIELRIAAMLSGDEDFVSVFTQGKDIHAAVASRVFGVPEAEVSKEMRRQAKVINFGILYGMGVNALKDNLGTGRAEAQTFYEGYFAAYPTLAGYLEKTKSDAAKTGYTQTALGRRRYFPAILSKIPYLRASAERMAINAPIQGTAADVIKAAMVSIDKEIKRLGWEGRARMILQIHDELVFEVEEDAVEAVSAAVVSAMESALPSDITRGVPLSVNASVGDTLATLVKFR
jgi:DNA polymerase-1